MLQYIKIHFWVIGRLYLFRSVDLPLLVLCILENARQEIY